MWYRSTHAMPLLHEFGVHPTKGRQSVLPTPMTLSLDMFSALASGVLVDTMGAEVKCSCMVWLAPCLCLPTISHEKNVPRVSRSKKNEKHMQQNGTWSAGWNRSSPADPWAHEVHEVSLWHFKVITQKNWQVKAYPYSAVLMEQAGYRPSLQSQLD